MIDVATLGFNVDSSQLEKAVVALTKFDKAAKGVDETAGLMSKTMSRTAEIFAGAISAMNKGILAFMSAMKGVSKEQLSAAKEASGFADKIYKASKAQDGLAASVKKTTNSLQTETKAMKAQQTALLDLIRGYKLSDGSINPAYSMFNRNNMSSDAFNALVGKSNRGHTEAQQMSRFNTANIAAQFQDVAVTAAMGMNPLTIALQQGTQLASVLMLVEKPLKSLKEAFSSLISPVSLLTIGLVALVAAGLQMVDWTSVAVSILNGLASAMQFVSDHAEGFATVIIGLGTVLLGLAIPTVIGWFISLGAAIAGIKFADLLSKLETVKNKLIKFGRTAKKTLSGMMNKWVLLIAVILAVVEGITLFRDKIKTYLDGAAQFIAGFINGAVNSFIFLKNVIIETSDVVKAFVNDGLEGAQKKLTETADESFKKEWVKADTIKSGLDATVDVVADFGETINKTITNSVKGLSNTLEGAFGGLADKIKGSSEEAKKAAEELERLQEAWDKLQAGQKRKTKDKEFETTLVGMDPYEALYQKNVYDLTNKALEQGITLDKEKTRSIEDLSKGYVDATKNLDEVQDSLSRYNEKVALAKSVTKGFVSDMRNGLQSGESAWDSFANAAINAVDKIIDKLLDVAIDIGIDSLINMAPGIFGHTVNVTGQAGKIAANSGGQIKMTNASYTPNAKGGVYSNGIYTSPTFFAFANGGKFGVMGEAGPEAVMPLTRGPDGSLGVRANGACNNNPVVVNVINNSTAQARTEERQTSQGVEIDVLIDELVADKMSTVGSSSNSALRAFNNQSLIKR